MEKFNKARVKIGDWVRVRFWDHRKNDDDIREYYVSGRVHRISVRAITVDTWALIDPESADRDPGETCETMAILRKGIIELILVIDASVIAGLEAQIKLLKKKLEKRIGDEN